jgi:nucleotide-binding universal stress UspA family protein
MFQNVLLAVALQHWDVPSPHAIAAREVAIQLAKGSSHPLAVLTVYSYPALPLVQPPLVGPEIVAESQQILMTEEAGLHADMAAKLRDYVEAIADAGVAVVPLIRTGSPREAAVRVAAEIGADCLVIGARSRHAVFDLGGMPYENTEGCWDYMSEAGKYARYLSLVRPDAFEDHRNPPPHIYMAPNGVRPSPAVQLTDLEDWMLPWIESDLSALLSLPLPIVDLVKGYTYDAIDQPYLVEVWVEKSTMDDVLLPLCQELHLNLVTSVGFQSITSAIRLLQRASALVHLGKPTRIFYISDFDPAGDGTAQAICQRAPAIVVMASPPQ